jgi:Iap family predicted aminopeptidase
LIDTSWTSKSISKYNGNPNTYMTAGNLVYAKEGYRLDLIVGLNVKASVMYEVLRNGDFRNLVVKPLNRINTKISLLTGDIYEFARRTVRKSC